VKTLRAQQLSIMQQFGASAFYTVVRWHKLGVVPHILPLSWPYVCQKLSNLVEIWQSSARNKLGHFFGPPCGVVLWIQQHLLESGAVIVCAFRVVLRPCLLCWSTCWMERS